jgi:hypothetical protein
MWMLATAPGESPHARCGYRDRRHPLVFPPTRWDRAAQHPGRCPPWPGCYVDTRGHGGYVLGSGSVRPEGAYRVVRRYPIGRLPGWLLTALTPQGPQPAPSARSLRPVSHRRAAAYLRAVVNGELAAVTAAGLGDRHTTLLRAARRLGQWAASGALAEAEARAALTIAAQHFVGVAGYTAAHVARDITDGLAYGARHPRRIVGLQTDLPQQQPTPGSACSLDRVLQHSTPPQRTRRTPTDEPTATNLMAGYT